MQPVASNSHPTSVMPLSQIPRALQFVASVSMVATVATLGSAPSRALPLHRAHAALVAAPTALTVVAASKSAVILSWSADAAAGRTIVERKSLGGAWPVATTASAAPNSPPTAATIATVTAAADTDSKIDQFATYVYRVRAIGANNVLSAPSNEVTVGPPPVGFTSVIAAPAAMHEHDPNQFAALTRMILDANGDPAIAYLTSDLNNDGTSEDTDISVITWSRARYRWNQPVSIDTVGNVARSGTRHAFSFARDEGTGRLGVLHMMGDHELRLSFSTDAGRTWTRAQVRHTGNEEATLSTPALALADGRVYLAYSEAGEGVQYRTGLASDTPDKWPENKAPLTPTTESARAECVSVVLDGSNKPIVGYCLNAKQGYTVTVAVWRPETGKVVHVMDTDNHQDDDPGFDIVARGTNMGALFYGPRDDKFYDTHHVWYSKSADGGATWSTPVVLADDGGNSMGSPMNLVLDRSMHAAAAANVLGGNDSDVKCGQPKLMRSTDGVSWNVCAPDTRGLPMADVVDPVVAFAGNDKLYMVFKTRLAVPGIVPGLVLWRER